MTEFYARFIDKENAYYQTLKPRRPTKGEVVPASFQSALTWLCRKSRSILDFGCGSGELCFQCAFLGVQEVLGIDLAEAGIRYASACAASVPQCKFVHGSVEKLRELPDDYYDGLILSNILDNLRPEDSIAVLKESVRVLRPGGKVLIKLNPMITIQQIRDWKIKILDEDLLDDGLLLWNKDDAFWRCTLKALFSSIQEEDLYFEEYNQHNRMFLCVK